MSTCRIAALRSLAVISSSLWVLGSPFLHAANPLMPAADPHAMVVSNTVWVYPTWTDRQGQRFFAFSSTNLLEWERHGPVLDFRDVTWIKDDGEERHYAWAPGVLESNGKCIDRVEYDQQGLLRPIAMTGQATGVAQIPPQLKSAPGTVRFFVDPAANSEDPEQRRAYGLSVIPPWPEGGWLFINLPEHLEYMPGTRGIARHHDNRQNVWQVSSDGAKASYAVESQTEPGVFFAVTARAEGDKARFEMSVTNRSTKTLKSIRPLLCFQYHHLQGFPRANSDNFAHTFVVVAGKPVAVADLPVKRPEAYARMAQVRGCADAHNWWAEEMGGFIEQPLDVALTALTAVKGDRKLVLSWRPGKNLLTNAAIPCIHADPCFGDLLPGEARTVHGELMFTREPLAQVVEQAKKK